MTSKNKTVKDYIKAASLIISVVLLIMIMSGCNVKRHISKNNAISSERIEKRDSTSADGSESKISVNNIITENKDINKDIDILFEGEIETTDNQGKVTKMNGKLNLSRKNQDKSVVESRRDSIQEKRDSAESNVAIHNDSTYRDNTILDEQKKSNALPLQFIAILVCGLIIIFIILWYKHKGR